MCNHVLCYQSTMLTIRLHDIAYSLQLYDKMWPSRIITHAICYMSEFPEPQQESAAACENRDIGPLKKGPKQIITIVNFHYLKTPGVEALSF